MKFYLVAIFCFYSMFAMAQNPTPTYTTHTDSANGSLVMRGVLSMEVLAKEPSFTWIESGLKAYAPQQAIISKLQPLLQQYTVTVFLGTWCDDSQLLVPQLFKVLQNAQYPTSQVIVYGVDRAKTTGGGQDKDFKITNVPTIILQKGPVEIGRITENVHASMEQDILDIVQSVLEHK